MLGQTSKINPTIVLSALVFYMLTIAQAGKSEISRNEHGDKKNTMQQVDDCLALFINTNSNGIYTETVNCTLCPTGNYIDVRNSPQKCPGGLCNYTCTLCDKGKASGETDCVMEACLSVTTNSSGHAFKETIPDCNKCPTGNYINVRNSPQKCPGGLCNFKCDVCEGGKASGETDCVMEACLSVTTNISGHAFKETIPDCNKCPTGNYINVRNSPQKCPGGLCNYTCTVCDAGYYARGHKECLRRRSFNWYVIPLVLVLLTFPCLFVAARVLYLEPVRLFGKDKPPYS